MSAKVVHFSGFSALQGISKFDKKAVNQLIMILLQHTFISKAEILVMTNNDMIQYLYFDHVA